MFTCANCGKEKSDDERGSVGWLGNIGFLFIMKMTWWPSAVCKDCSRQVRLFGMVGVIIAAVAVTIFVVGKWWS
jgi:hypothetical protein